MDLKLLIQAILDKVKSRTSIRADIKELEKTPFYIKILAKLDKSRTKAEVKRELKEIESKGLDLKVVSKLDKSKSKAELKKAIKEIENDSGTSISVSAVLNNKGNLSQISNTLDSLDTNIEIDADGKALNEVAGGIDNINKRSLSALAALRLMQEALRGLDQIARNMVNTSISLDKQLTNLRMVTGQDYSQAERVLSSYNDMAHELSATTSQVLNASDEWLRQGKTVEETNELIKQSMILSKVGAMDAADATKNLTSAMKGYGLEVENVSEIVDRLTSIDLEAAVSSSDLAVAMSHTASSANIAGVEMSKLLSYLAVTQEVTQKSASSIGESYKTIFQRMGNVKLGRFIDDDGEDISDVETILKHFDIALRDTKDNFRDFGSVLDEVGGRWQSFTNVEQHAIATAFAGVRQQENFLVLMENYGRALELTEIAADSAGNSLERFSVYQDGIEAKANEFVAALESLSFNTLDADFIKTIIEAGTELLKVIDNLNLLKTTLIALSALGAAKGLGFLRTHAKTLYVQINQLNNAFNILKNSTQAGLGTEHFKQLTVITKNLNASQLRLVLSNKSLRNEQRITLLMSKGLTEAQARQTLTTYGLATAEGVAATKTGLLAGAFKTLTAAIAANPIGFSIVTLTTLMSVASTISAKLKSDAEELAQKESEARQRSLEAAESAKSHADSILELQSAYVLLSNISDRTESQEAQYKSTQSQIIDLLGSRAEALNGLKSGTEEYRKELEKLTAEELKRKQIEIIGGISAAEGEVSDVSLDYFEMSSGQKKLLKDTLGDYYSELTTHHGRYTTSTPIIGGVVENPDTRIGYYSALSKAQMDLYDEYTQLLDAGKAEEAQLIINSELYNFLGEEINKLQSPVEKLIELRTSDALLDFWRTNDMPETVDEYDNMVEAVTTAVGVHESFNDTISDIIGKSFPQFNTKIAENEDNIESWGDTVSDIVSQTSLLNKALAEQSANGKISAETYAALIAKGDDYAKLVSITKDGYILLTDETKKYNNELVTQAIQTAVANGATEEHINYLFSLIEATSSVTDELNKSTSALLSSAKSMSSAFSEMHSNGEISLETALNLIENGYATALMFDAETGAIRINADAYLNLNRAMIDAQITKEQIALLDIKERFEEEKRAVEGLTEAYYKNTDAKLENEILAAKSASYDTEKELAVAETRIAMLEKLRDRTQEEVISGKYGSSSSDSNKEAFDKWYKEQKHLVDMGKKDQGEFLVELDSMYKKHFSDRSKYADEYRQYELEVYKGLKELNQEKYDDIIAGIETIADKRVKALEKEKDVLKAKNDEEKKANDLLKAQNDLKDANINLDNARKKEVWVYEEGKGFVKKQDEKAVREAEEALADAKQKIVDYDTDAQIAKIDAQIKEVQDRKNVFTDIKKDYENAEKIAKAEAFFKSPSIPVGMSEKQYELFTKVKSVDFQKKFLDLVNADIASGAFTYPVKQNYEKVTESITNSTNNIVNNNNRKQGDISINVVYNITESDNPSKTLEIIDKYMNELLDDVSNRPNIR